MCTNRNPSIWAAALIALIVIAAACAPPPAPSTHPVPNPGPGQTVALAWPHTPAPSATNVRYGTGERQVGDVYLPTAGGNRGVIIAVHGGGFTAGDKADVRSWFGSATSQTRRGFAVFSVNYRLTSGQRNVFPAAVNDLSAAVQWVRTHGAEWGMNPRTVIIAGGSAGGTIAALVGTASNTTTHPLARTAVVDGWISYAGLMDFTGADPVPNAHGKNWLGQNWRHPGWRNAASAVRHIDPADPPGYIVHGDQDDVVPVAQMHSLVGAAANQGITRRLHHDLVDTGGVDRSRGHGVPCRWHLPMCGANHAALNSWIDAVDARRL